MIISPQNFVTKSRKTNISSGRTKYILAVVNVIVFIDLLGVAVLVPLLPAIFRELGATQNAYGVSRSVYNAAQVVGGLALGALSDGALSRRTVLLISFLGSFVSYLIVGLTDSLKVLIFSRVLVGLVKQTMTISTAMVTDFSTNENRAKELGRLGGASSLAFIAGPSLGSFLYQKNPMYPSLLAAGLFLVNSAILLLFVPSQPGTTSTKEVSAAPASQNEEKSEKKKDQLGSFSKFWKNFRETCTMPAVLWLVTARLTFGFLARAMSSSGSIGYLEDRFGLETYMLGYIRSYQSICSLICQVFLVDPIVKRQKETTLITLAIAALACINLFEGVPSIGIYHYLFLSSPIKSLSFTLLRICLESQFTKALPKSSTGAALSTLNVLQSVVGVLSPLYSGKIFAVLDVDQRPVAAGIHYLFFLFLWYFVCQRFIPTASNKEAKMDSLKKSD